MWYLPCLHQPWWWLLVFCFVWMSRRVYCTWMLKVWVMPVLFWLSYLSKWDVFFNNVKCERPVCHIFGTVTAVGLWHKLWLQFQPSSDIYFALYRSISIVYTWLLLYCHTSGVKPLLIHCKCRVSWYWVSTNMTKKSPHFVGVNC